MMFASIAAVHHRVYHPWFGCAFYLRLVGDYQIGNPGDIWDINIYMFLFIHSFIYLFVYFILFMYVIFYLFIYLFFTYVFKNTYKYNIYILYI